MRAVTLATAKGRIRNRWPSRQTKIKVRVPEFQLYRLRNKKPLLNFRFEISFPSRDKERTRVTEAYGPRTPIDHA